MIYPSWKAYFIFSNKEIKGIIVLGIILFCSVCIRFFFPTHDVNRNEKETKEPHPVLHLEFFDPNTVDSMKAIYIGIPEKQVKNLLRYRAKGGYFKNNESFSKLYGLSPELFNVLSPYIRIAKTEKIENRRYQPTYDRSEEKFWKIDINKATAKDWKAIAGLPDPLITRIMAYKHFRGGFLKPNELSKVYGFSDTLYQRLKPHLAINNQNFPVLNSNAMNFNDWRGLGLFTTTQIWTILKLKQGSKGHLTWTKFVEALDLTQSEAIQIKAVVRFEE